MDIHKIVKKLSKKNGIVLDLEDLSEYVDPGFWRGEQGKRDTYKLVYALKSLGILIPIKNGMYLVSSCPETANENDYVRMVEDAYWKIVKKLIRKNCGGDYVLAWPKSLEIRMRDFSIPDTLIVYTKNYDWTLLATDRSRIVFKTAKSGSKTGRMNAFPIFLKFSQTETVDGTKFTIAWIEHAILDSLIVHKGIPKTDEYAILKFLSKYPKSINREKLGKLVSCKYLTAVNRLREIARDKGIESVYEKALDVVKREGGNCFVTSSERLFG